MFPEEALWLREHIAALPGRQLSPLLNVGSGDAAFRRTQQPWIEEHIFAPLNQRAVSISHLDIFSSPGVDIVGDLCEPEVLATLERMGLHSLICANVLEHTTEPALFAANLLNLLPSGGLLFVTCPRAYPYHACPIDTLFRPDVDELHELFPGTRLLAGEVIHCGSFASEVRRQPLLALRLLLPVYKPKRWYGLIRRTAWLTRQYLASCVVLEKQSEGIGF